MRRIKKLNNRELRFLAQSMGMYIKTHSDSYSDDFYQIMEKFLFIGFSDDDVNTMVQYFEHY